MELSEIVARLESLKNPVNLEGMARFGIETEKAFGVKIPVLRQMAKEAGRDHYLAEQLWQAGYHETRIMAAYVDEPSKVTPQQMDDWVGDFNSWDLCDQVCSNLFDRTPYALEKAAFWIPNEETFVRRAGFVVVTALSVHDKKLSDEVFLKFIPDIVKYATDSRNFVKKAVNWCIRQVGKRNQALNREMISLSYKLLETGDKTAGWIAKDAIKELESQKIQDRLKLK